MRAMRIILVAAVGALALCAITADAASATVNPANYPALYECAKAGKETVEYKEGTKTKKKAVYTGAYTEKKCATAATEDKYRVKGEHPGPEGKYELQEWAKAPSKVKAFKGGSKAGANLEDLSLSAKLSCTSYTDEGKFNGPKTAEDVKVIFKGCVLGPHACKSEGASAGEIKVNPLKGEDGYLSKEKHEVGVSLTNETGKYLVTILCDEGEDKLRVSGAIVGKVEPPYNVFTKEATFTFLQHAAVQQYEKLEGKPKALLMTEIRTGTSTFGPEPCEPVRWAEDNPGGCETGSGEETKALNKGEELELKA